MLLFGDTFSASFKYLAFGKYKLKCTVSGNDKTRTRINMNH